MKYVQSIRFKLMLLVVIPLFVVAVSFIGVSMYTSNLQISDNNLSASESTEQTALAIFEQWREATLSQALIAADHPTPDLIAAMEDRDAGAIIALMQDKFTATGCDGMTLTDMDGNALARVTNPEKYGDNIKTSLAIADAMEGKSVSYAYPTSNNGFSITAGVPITNEGTQIGVLFLSKRLDSEKTITQLKNLLGCDIILYQADQPLMNSFADQADVYAEALSAELWTTVSSGASSSATAAFNGVDTVQRFIPLAGRDGAIVGALRTIQVQETYDWIVPMWAIIFVSFMIILYPLVSWNIVKLVKPIRSLAAQAGKLAQGDMNVELTQNRRDEIGLLQGSMIEMVRGMQDQSQAIEQIASGNLSIQYTPRSEVDSVGNSIVDMLRQNNAVFAEIRRSADQVSSAADQVAQGSQSLAQGTTEQAATIERFGSLLSDVQTVTNQKHRSDPCRPSGGQPGRYSDGAGHELDEQPG